MTGRVIVLRGDAAHLPLPDGSMDSVVCDPPYALTELPVTKVVEALAAWLGGDRGYVPKTGAAGGFMGREWDKFVPPLAAWDECLRVLKPGGWLLAFAAPRTQDLMGLSIRLAGFEIRDGIDWIYGQGMPKSLDVSKAIDKRGGNDGIWFADWLAEKRAAAALGRREVSREFPSRSGGVTGKVWNWEHGHGVPTQDEFDRLCDLLSTDRMSVFEAERQVTAIRSGIHAGYGPGETRAPNPRQPHSAPGTPDAAQWQGWGTGLKPAHEPIVCARKPIIARSVAVNVLTHGTGALNLAACQVGTEPRTNNAGGTSSLQRVSRVEQGYRPTVTTSRNEASDVTGRWPPNVLLSEDAAAEMDRQSGVLTSGANPTRRGSDKFRDAYGDFAGQPECVARRGADSGGASRFFPIFRYEAKASTDERPRLPDGTAWATVKPVALMRWLVRLVTPPGGTILDPFCGTGTTGEAAIIEGFDAILLDKDPQAIALTRVRLAKPMQPVMFAPEPAAERSVPKPPPPVPGSLFDLGEAS